MKQLDDRGQTIHWLKSIFSPRRTLLVIDMQNDFISGSLAVPGAEEIIEKVENLTKLDIWYQVELRVESDINDQRSRHLTLRAARIITEFIFIPQCGY